MSAKKLNVAVLKNCTFPFLYSIFFLGFFIFPSSKALNNFYYVAIAFPFLFMVLFNKIRFKPILSVKTFRISALFLFYMWLSLFWSEDFGGGDIWKYGRRALYILCFIATTIYLVNTRSEFFRRLMRIFCWIAAVVSVVYSIYFYTRNPFPEQRLVGYALLRNPIGASSIYGIAFFASLYLAYTDPGRKDRIIYGIFCIPIFSYMLLAQSRGPLVSIFGAMVIWQAIIFSRVGLKRGIAGKFALLLLTIVFASVATIFLVPEFYQYFILERGLSYRIEIWGNFIELIQSAPLVGHGLKADTNTVVTDGTQFLHPHSVYLATFYFGGFIGLMLQIFMIGYCLFQSIRLGNRGKSFFLTSSLLFGAFCIATDGHTLIQHPKPFWIFFWFPVALCAASEASGNFSRNSLYKTHAEGSGHHPFKKSAER